MSLWTRTGKPKFCPHAVASKSGWTHPVSNETLETFGTKPTPVATPAVQQVTFYKGFFSASGDAKRKKTTTFSTGDYLEFAVRFNGQVTVVGSPYLEVVINGVTRHAAYVATGWGPGSATLMFVYRLVGADVATVGNVSLGVLQLNSGHIYALGTLTACTLTIVPTKLLTLTNVVGNFHVNDAVTDVNAGTGYVVSWNPTSSLLAVVNTSGTFTTDVLTDSTSGATATISTVAADLSNVVISSSVPGTETATVLDHTYYKSGDLVTITTTWDRPITVTGTPQITINVNGVHRLAGYAAGTGTTSLTFTYTVVAGDDGDAGTVSLLNPIVPNGGTLVAAAVPVTMTIVLPDTSLVEIDGTVPVAPTVTGITNGHHYVSGDSISLTVTYDEPIVVTGTPTIPLTMTSGNKNASYTGGTGTSVLTFVYTPVVSGNVTVAGTFSVGSPISGTLKDLAGNVATKTFTPPTTTTVYVN